MSLALTQSGDLDILTKRYSLVSFSSPRSGDWAHHLNAAGDDDDDVLHFLEEAGNGQRMCL